LKKEEHIVSSVWRKYGIPNTVVTKTVNILQKKWMEIAEKVGNCGKFLSLLCTVGYATTNECYNEQFLSIKSGCYNERGGP
jgi:hypothetical protein